MSHEKTVQIVGNTLCQVLADVDKWFDRAAQLRRFKPASGGWSIDQVLEHITLTNRFLMLTLNKYGLIAERRSRRGDPVPPRESSLDPLLVIGDDASFGWIRPEYMEPTGTPTSIEVRDMLHRQLEECLILLERMSDGIGALCQVTMTVNNLGKIDLYQWLYLLAQHARRHLQQMQAVEDEYKQHGRK